jgi:methionyl-tRNA formyltransferase
MAGPCFRLRWNHFADNVPGRVVNTENTGIIVQTGNGQIAVTELQLQNRVKMGVEEFLRGYNLQPGEVLGGASPDDGNKG